MPNSITDSTDASFIHHPDHTTGGEIYTGGWYTWTSNTACTEYLPRSILATNIYEWHLVNPRHVVKVWKIKDDDMEEMNIDDVSVDEPIDILRFKIPYKGWYTMVGNKGIEYYTLLSGTFKMKDETVLKCLADELECKSIPTILLNHESDNPEDKLAIRVYYSTTVSSTKNNILTTKEINKLIQGQHTWFLGYIPGKRGEYLNKIIVDHWKRTHYKDTEVSAVAIFQLIPAPGKDARFWNVLLKITLMYDDEDVSSDRTNLM